MITKLWAINVLHASQVEGKALAFLPFYKNAIRRIHPLQFLWNCTDLPFWCLWHGPENFIEIFADLRILDPTDHERQLINTSRPASNLKERPENWLLRIEIWFGKRRIFIKGLFVTSLCFPLSQHRGFYFPPSDKSDGPPFSPERETCCMLSICRTIAFLTYNAETGISSCNLPFSSTASLWTNIDKPIKLLLSWKKGWTASQKLTGDSWLLYVRA